MMRRYLFLVCLLIGLGLALPGVGQPELAPPPGTQPDQAQVLAQLGDPDPAVRAKAAAQLVPWIYEERVREPLRALLRDEELSVRVQAAQSLARGHDYLALPVLCEGLMAANAEMRLGCVRSISFLGVRSAADHIYALRDDPDPQVRDEVISTLVTLRDSRATPLALARLASSEAQTRITAAGLLGSLQDLRGVGPLCAVLQDATASPRLRSQAASALGRIAVAHAGAPELAPAWAPLTAALADADAELRGAAAGALGRLYNLQAIPLLLPLLQDPQASVRDNAAGALVRLNDPRGVEAICARLKTGDDRYRVMWVVNTFSDAQLPRAIATLGELAKAPQQETRVFAVTQLGELRDPRGVPFLLDALTDTDPVVRRTAASALASSRDPQAVPPLLTAMQDPDEGVRETTAQTLGSYTNDPRIHAAGMALLTAVDPAARQRGIRLLSNSQSRQSALALFDLLADPDEAVRKLAYDTLRQYQYTPYSRMRPVVARAIALLQAPLPQPRQFAAGILGTTSSACAAAPLVAAVQDPDVNVRAAALEALAWSAPDDMRVISRLLTTVTPLVQDEALLVRQGAVRALARYIEYPRAIPPLVTALRDTDSTVRTTAVEALARSKDPRAAAALLAQLSLPDAPRPPYAWLAGRAEPAALAALAKALEDKDDQTRLMALFNIGMAHPEQPAVQQLLLAALPREMRGANLEALSGLQDARNLSLEFNTYGDAPGRSPRRAIGALFDAGRRMVPAVLERLTAGTPEEQVAAIIILTRANDARAVEPLLTVLQGKDPLLRALAARGLGRLEDIRALAPLTAALQEADPRLRGQAAWALAKLGDARAVPPLLVALQDREADVVFLAARGLGLLKAPQAVAPLLRLLQEHPDAGVRGQAAWALGEIGDKQAVEPLLAALRQADWELRGAVVEALGKFGDPRAAEPLLAMLGTLPKAKARWEQPRGEWPAAAYTLRAQAILALCRCQERRVFPYLLRDLGSTDYETRKAAIAALQAFPDPQLLAELPRLFVDDYSTAYEAYKVAGVAAEPAREFLLKALQSDNLSVRLRAVEAIYYMPKREDFLDARTRDIVYTALTREDMASNFDGFVMLGQQGDTRVVDYLAKRLDHADGYRWIAIMGLSHIPQPRALEMLLTVTTDPNATPQHRCYAGYWIVGYGGKQAKALPIARLATIYLGLLKAEHTTLRQHAVSVLGYLPDPRVPAALKPFLADADPQMRKTAVLAMGRLKHPLALPGLIAILQDPTDSSSTEAIKLLSAYKDPRVVEALTAALQDPTGYYADNTGLNSVRISAARTLATLGDRRAIPALIAALDSGYLPGRQAAADALKTLTGQDFGLDREKWRAWVAKP